MRPIHTPSDALRKGTLIFLVLPQVIFFLGWMRFFIALPVCVMLGFAVWRAGFGRRCVSDNLSSRVENLPGPSWTDRKGLRSWLVAVCLPALILTLLSGAGGWGGGDSDWLKHDTLLRDLVARPWPLSYQTDRGPVLLVYYHAFYLPAALVGKLSGASGDWLAGQFLALTTWVGLMLSAAWLIVLGYRPAGSAGNRLQTIGASSASIWLGAAVFFGFSGLDPLGKVLVNLFLRLPVLTGDWSDVEWWAQFAQYSSNAATVFWAPQHAFGGWLPAALAVDDWLAGEGRLESSWVLYLACAVPWSPFAAVGLAALLVGLLLWRWTWPPLGKRDVWRRCFTWSNAGGTMAGVCFALYLLAHFQSFYLPAAYRVTPGRHPMPLLEQSHLPWIVLYLGFVAIEFGGLSLALAFSLRRKQPDAEAVHPRAAEIPLLVTATLVLLILPWFHYGYANDLVMRGGIPALFVLQMLLVRLLACARRTPPSSAGLGSPGRWPALLAGCLLCGGLVNVGLEYRRHIVRIVAQGSLRDARTSQPVRTLAELHRTIYARPGFDFSRQYLGSADSFFARYMARRGVIKVTRSPESAAVDFD